MIYLVIALIRPERF
ncbi:MAG TPA: K(+)-transporting ATPase subunit F [Methylocella sp.]|nr:K(+)-transporting ATPase subunit F [Methylocella sp.]